MHVQLSSWLYDAPANYSTCPGPSERAATASLAAGSCCLVLFATSASFPCTLLNGNWFKIREGKDVWEDKQWHHANSFFLLLVLNSLRPSCRLRMSRKGTSRRNKLPGHEQQTTEMGPASSFCFKLFPLLIIHVHNFHTHFGSHTLLPICIAVKGKK